MRLSLLAAIFVLAVACGESSPTASPSPTASLSPTPDVKAIMVANLQDGVDATELDLYVQPFDVALRDNALFVSVRVPSGPQADQMCRTVAAFTHDPTTSKSLGIVAIILVEDGQKVATCQVTS
jgi:hypothetical protein